MSAAEDRPVDDRIESIWRIIGTERHWPGRRAVEERLRRENIGADVAALKTAFDDWMPRAAQSRDGMGVGFIHLYVENEHTGERKRIVFSTTDKQIFITLEEGKLL